MVKILVNKIEKTGQLYKEDLGNGIELEMVLIPGGSFIMGAPETEEGSSDDERPQHKVTVSTFFMGRYPITQAQWKTVAALDKVNRDLNPDPSRFKGDNRPVECVSWYDAVEFCQRLSNKHPKRQYRLPSESEWEYACRAGSTTPFHFGDTISTDVANYCGTDDKENKWSGSYGRGSKGIYRQETTEVGSFDAANGFGLYDMHGNVWEWCADHWHDNYEGAPTDGSAWVDENENDNRSRRLLRGGSWISLPEVCRSASRSFCYPVDDYLYVGFRVVCGGGAARTL
ncbi:formylglycine-generating enzyme family protein [Aetokthonos hydrillicola Thurmond2011]|jgi:formylglycine-generating enzyme required for sulfatase activity|uniref:Formylglycine-generating enzyme family protein n=1 Tax=Aetokthonos hydrillicola Thurmond2011 TaxID=2712845 RepID=A0AAP5I7R7_9CYAN|nr:formylglycine-generating enzyme family protein [Aetokthonos hydrillicola]MBO3457297.1 formylglycine-generating enzyme family protein [Aetokthonos hydrillicola CCALA 1050]MBW4586643.1 formylglycine-generating enzyme family protein [Aetokthonos hydrillicola CCALA 1050]MDR9894030.1 formylglycine-generating enzyme family protein [Aetokthonos hydrillicola Thurmond2011]